jgi:hypothetical protein
VEGETDTSKKILLCGGLGERRDLYTHTHIHTYIQIETYHRGRIQPAVGRLGRPEDDEGREEWWKKEPLV